MKRLRTAVVAIALASASCGGGSSTSTCLEHAGEIHELIDSGAAAEDITTFLSDTKEHAARLIAGDPDKASPCVDAILEASFSAAFEDIAYTFEG